MKLSDFLLFPDPTIKVTDEIDLIPYSPPESDDPEVARYLDMLVAADTETSVRMVLKLAFDAWANDELKIDQKIFRELARFSAGD